MVIGVLDRARGSAAKQQLRHRIDPAHVALIAVSVAYWLLVLLRMPQTMTLTFDESVYASQLSAYAPGVGWSPHRAWGVPLMLAPVVMVTDSVVVLRVYLTLVSGVLMYLAFRPWLAALRGRFRYVPAVAAGCFATLWMTVLFGNMAYPNLWLAFVLVAGVGYFYRVIVEPPPAWVPVIGVFIAFAAASLVRPTDATFAAAPLLVVACAALARRPAQAPLVVRVWRRVTPAVAVGAGLFIGWAMWAVEAYERFGGPLERLRLMSLSTGSGFVNSLPANLAAVDGPSLLCRPASNCAGASPAAAAWWVLLPVLVAAGLVVAARTRWFGAAALATASAVLVAVPYLFLLDYTSPRFLLPAYALLMIPVAGLLVWLTGLGGRATRTMVTAAVVIVLLLHATAQQDVLETARGRMERTYGDYSELVDFLAAQGVRPPCLIWGRGALPLSYRLGCRSQSTNGRVVPRPDDRDITAALARGETVVVRIRADEPPPPVGVGWRRVELPVVPRYVAYVYTGR
jgi:hypothetical protein